MAINGAASKFELPEVCAFSANNWGLHFKDQELERAYSDEVSSTAYRTMQRMKRWSGIVGLFGIAVIFVYRYMQHSQIAISTIQGVSKDSGWNMLRNVMVFFAYPVALHATPQRFVEHFSCFLTLMLQVVFLFTNPFRLHRLSLAVIDGGTNIKWASLCDEDLVESARDTVRVAVALTIDSVFHLFVHVRTLVSFF